MITVLDVTRIMKAKRAFVTRNVKDEDMRFISDEIFVPTTGDLVFGQGNRAWKS